MGGLEADPMKRSVALRERGRLAVLVNSLLHRAAQQPGWRGPDPRGVRRRRQDVWAALVLKGKQFFPLARHLYSSRHPRLRSQNRVEEAVLGMARGLARRLGLRVIAVGDRGLGRKELLIRLAQQDQPFVFRIDT